MNQSDYTDFGYKQVLPQEKRKRVTGLFDSVANNYDVMNDLMSFGIHRLWKRYAVHIAELKEGNLVLDVAGGTCDMAKLFSDRVKQTGNVVVCDISHEMITQGRARLLNSGIFNNLRYIQGDAEELPFSDNSFDLVCIAFGLRNVTDKAKALRSMYSKLKYGKQLIILEFSKLSIPLLQIIYEKYSDYCIPWLGKLIASDEESYRYLIESIRIHPDQKTLKCMIEDAGFSKVDFFNLSGGVVAIHTAYKI
jgi:demethylmenaquinone methyltransferase / 2-methoxy-6-polyprenyl-1,4-benzoquinol methylase